MKIDVTCNRKFYKALCKLADVGGVSKGNIIANCVALLDYVEERKEQGEILALVKDGEIKQEIVFP